MNINKAKQQMSLNRANRRSEVVPQGTRKYQAAEYVSPSYRRRIKLEYEMKLTIFRGKKYGDSISNQALKFLEKKLFIRDTTVSTYYHKGIHIIHYSGELRREGSYLKHLRIVPNTVLFNKVYKNKILISVGNDLLVIK